MKGISKIKESTTELLDQMEKELNKLEKSYRNEQSCDIETIVDGMAEVSEISTMAQIKIREEYPEVIGKVEWNKSMREYEAKQGEQINPDALKILNQFDKLFNRFTDAGTEIPYFCSCHRKKVD